MKFQRVRLSNFKCYEDAALGLEGGVTVIHGLNGSGKSSLLEACFFALYGSKALDATLDEVVTIGADDTEVELWFRHGGVEYHVERRVRASGDQPKTTRCVLETPDATIEGARDVRSYVADLLRMDHEAFVNCAYVRQGEVNKLINASPEQRQDMLDSLLQLGKLEDYRDRASDARVGVGRVRDDKQGALSQLDEQIEQKEAKDLPATLNELRSERADVEDEIERIESQRERAVETRDEAAELLDQYEQKRAELDEIEDEIESLRTAISETERERETLADEMDELRDQRAELEDEIEAALAEADLDATTTGEIDAETIAQRHDKLDERIDELQSEIKDVSVEAANHANTAENHREAAENLQAQAADKREQAEQLEDDVSEARASLEQRRAKLDDLDSEVESLRAEFEDAPIAFGEADSFQAEISQELQSVRERIAQLDAEIEAQRESIAEAERLLEAGKCPECGQSVEGAPHVETLDDDREELAELEAERDEVCERRDKLSERLDEAERLLEIEADVEQIGTDRDNIAQLIEEREETVVEKADQAEQLRADADELESEADERRDQAADADAKAERCRERVGDLNQEKANLTDRRDRLERLESLLDDREDIESEIEQARERRDALAETNDERRERLADKRERRSELQSEFDEDAVESAREEKERAEQYIEKADRRLEELEERHDELGQQIGGVRNELDELESLRERRESVAAQVERLNSLYEEAEQLQQMYGDLRAQLRQQNVESLEAMLNEIFDLIYQNDSYARIELSGEYELTVYQKDGEQLDPEQLSGGERALFNLSLRCAIYRLLAEGIEGTAPMPPLILDEPTVFLDSGHVSQLVELVGAMREYGVEQILVVSHDEALIGAADDLVRVRKDATTNRSTVERTTATEALLRADTDTDAEAD